MSTSKQNISDRAGAALDNGAMVAALSAKLARLERRLVLRERQLNEVLATWRPNASEPEKPVAAAQPSRPKAPTSRSDYPTMVSRVRALAESVVPSGSKIIVVSRGDDELLKLGGRTGWHFPQNENGVYAGHYPANSAEAIRHLEELRVRGGEFLLFPATAFWWLEHYAEFRAHLSNRYSLAASDEKTAQIFDLRGRRSPVQGKTVTADNPGYTALVKQIRRMTDHLLPTDAKVAVVSRGDPALLQLGSRPTWHVPLDASGRYAGHHPANGAAAVAQIKAARARGAQFLVIPATMLWWLDYYRELARHLQTRCRLVQHQPHVGNIYEL